MIGGFADEHYFLSNFAPIAVVWMGRSWRSAEHAFQGAKCLIPHEQDAIHRAETPGQSKRLGRRCQLRPDWEEVKDDVMFGILLSKFARNPHRRRLLDTGPHVLVEGNTWHDNYWGDCICGRPACQREGKNMLGHLLMRTRAIV